MHTAMRIAVLGAEAVRRQQPELPICFYGLYAPVSRERTLGRLADRLIAGEYEPALVGWASSLDGGSTLDLGRHSFEVPARDLLPPLQRYAHLALGGEERPVGYVEASHGCVHKCRHCPVPVVYDGRIRVVPQDVVLADVEQLVAMGARHITFGDPDFLNGRKHSLSVVRAMHEHFPDLTFDCTTKVEHILELASVWPELARHGCLFVTSALECMNDDILARLDKGHTRADAANAVALLREHCIELRPSFLPFTPWTTERDVLDILDFVVEHDLIGNVDPVQYAIRLLLPEGSLLLPDVETEGYDPEALTYAWESPLDELQRQLSEIVETGARNGEPIATTFYKVRQAVGAETAIPMGSTEGRPRLTEPWFC